MIEIALMHFFDQQMQRLLCKWHPDDHRLACWNWSQTIYLTTNNTCSTLCFLMKRISVTIYITATTTDNWWENLRIL